MKLADAAGEIYTGLRDLTREGGPDNYMVVSAGEIYVQFAGHPGNSQILCESISNEYLPDQLKVPPKAIKKLERLGFVLSGDEIKNFSRTYKIANAKQARALAGLTVRIFEEVYGLTRTAELHIEVSLV